ncbi:MAG TPA: helix-turn-helix domain-containing protein [Lentimicrobium sp.]|nr:helix-turn-helix domain-containing protein [Lentimicrobium sp.]
MLNYPQIDFIAVDAAGYEAAYITCFPVNSNNNGNSIANEIQSRYGGIFAFFCITGSVEFSLNEHVIKLGEKRMCSFFTSNLYGLIGCSDDFSGYMLFISSYYILNIDSHIAITYFINSYSEPFLQLEEKDADNLELLLHLAAERLKKKEGNFNRELVYHMLMILLHELVDIYERKQRTDKKRPREESLLKDYLILVNKYCEKEHKLGFYAHKLAITPKHLSLTVKKLTGRTGAEWIDYVLLLKIKRMLLNSPLTIQQISDEFNFPDNSAFGKYFKANTGITPRQYRSI